MRNPGTDFHRRAADQREANAIIARDEQKQRNADEWVRRAHEAFDAGDDRMFADLLRQADLETRRLYDGRDEGD